MGEVAKSLYETTILEIKPPSTRIRIFLNLQLFLCGSGFTRIRWIRHTNPQLSESALQRGNFWMSYKSGIMWTLSLNHTYPSPNRWGALGRETRRVRGWRRMTFQTLWVGAKSHFCGRKIRIFPYTVTFCPVLYREYSRRCPAQYYRFFTSCTSVSSLITFVQVNLQSGTKVVDTLV